MSDVDSKDGPLKKKAASLLRFFGKGGARGVDASGTGQDASPREGNAPVGKAAAATEAEAPAERSLVAFKNGRLALAEKKLGLERHPSVVAAVFGFHQFVAQRRQEDGMGGLPISSIPREHWPLVAMLVQERDAAMPSLARSIETQLCPVLFGEDGASHAGILAAGVVESTIEQLAESRNYGVPLDEVQRASHGCLDETPPALSINRWEVKDAELLPSDVRAVVLKRRSLREDARAECVQWFRSLAAEAREQLLSGVRRRPKGKAHGALAAADGPAGGASAELPVEASPRKARIALRGQRSLQNFFATERQLLPAEQRDGARGYYASTFLPFNIRHNTEMFRPRQPASFDSRRIDRILAATPGAGGAAPAAPHIPELLRELARSSKAAAVAAAPGAGATSTVCDGLDLDEGEVHLMRLRTQRMKLVQFHGTRRPGYFGTWSRGIRHVSGRRPFAQDTAELDYSVDSDADWGADDEEGEELRSEDEDDEDEDDEDFDDEGGFVVGDSEALPRTHRRSSLDMDGESGSEGSDFDSDDELEEINPDEEVCDDDMDVDDEADCSSAPAGASTAPDRGLAKPKQRRHKDGDAHRPQQRKQVVPLTPVVVGLIQDVDMDICGEGAGGLEARTRVLAHLAVVVVDGELPLSIDADSSDVCEAKKADGASGAGHEDASDGARRGKVITDEDLCALARVVHGSSLGVSRLVEELKQLIPEATKAQIERLIHEHARKEKRPPTTRPLWYVSADLVGRVQTLRLTGSAVSAPAVGGVAVPLDASEAAAKRQKTDVGA
ncbi:hypothetical protein IWQ56_001599 [Coemansia nantahalensis]|nr:hypothetical protein IWQ56_001599 [Coemansia nantahalensis]